MKKNGKKALKIPIIPNVLPHSCTVAMGINTEKELCVNICNLDAMVSRFVETIQQI